MDSLIVTAAPDEPDIVEIVERKGLGHPDTICDALAENLSRNLCREYRDRFGEVLHYNVDKALLCAGRARAAFGGGEVLAPIAIHLAGRATTAIGSSTMPIRDIAIEGSRAWLESNLHALDSVRHVEIHETIQPGSQELRQLFARSGQRNVPLANDTSIGVGYAPLSRLERLVLGIENRINTRKQNDRHQAWGEDVKVMGVRHGNRVLLTIACAMIGRHLRHIDDYRAEVVAIERLARQLAGEHGFADCDAGVNMADDVSAGAVYLTVTGSSAEAGDDGQVGRGNRVNGLITPCRPMSLEAAAGKNPVNHVGKIYNVVARQIAEALVARCAEIAGVECLLVSRIGMPVTEPSIVRVKIATRDGLPVDRLRHAAAEIAAACLNGIPMLVDGFIAGTVDVF